MEQIENPVVEDKFKTLIRRLISLPPEDLNRLILMAETIQKQLPSDEKQQLQGSENQLLASISDKKITKIELN